MRVLVAEDDAAIRHLVRRALDREGFTVVEAADGGEALRAARDGDFQLAIVDLGLPDMSGLEVIAGLRQLIDDLHVIIMSGASSEQERVQGLIAGADDYMVKPVSLRELAARAMGVDRRQSARHHLEAGSSPRLGAGTMSFGDITIDVPGRRVTRSGEAVELTRREFDLLSYLSLHPGVSISRERLLEVVWSSSASWQSVSTITEHVRRLRAKLEDDPAHPRWIVTVRGAGYRLDARSGSAAAATPAMPAAGPAAAPAPGAQAIAGARTGADEDGFALDADIRRALAANEFEVFYQPVLKLSDRSVLAVEALMRWRHPRRGLLEPAAFMEAAERSGLIIDIGIQVLNVACRQLRIWREAGHQLHLSINLSARQLSDLALPERIESMLVANSVPVGSLWLEVSETTLIEDVDRATTVLERTEMLGTCMVIDDFGTGWGGFTYLQKFPVHALKIDRVFVAGLGVSANDRAIIRSILSLGRELGLVVIAEGIETEEQLEQLRALGCQFGQGYLFSRPVPPEDLDLGPVVGRRTPSLASSRA